MAGRTQNVRVAVRVRPFNGREKGLSSKSIADVLEDGKTIELVNPAGDKLEAGDAKRTFVFDHAYGWESEQASVYRDLAQPIIEQALRGYNGTIFAYGQTGSGKTYTMMGSPEDPGLIPLMNKSLFETIAALSGSTTDGRPLPSATPASPTAAAVAASPPGSGSKDGGGKETASSSDRRFLVIVSYLEIYNEVVKDLLNPSDKQLMIREHPEMGIYVQDLAELVVKNADDVVKLLAQGQKVRHVAATAMNDRSSRSHSCFTIKIEQKTRETFGAREKVTTLTAKVNLVDLAGSERAAKTGATGEILKQGAAINKSLSALGNVINALAEGQRGHIPYRDSKLTRLLQQSLGGNSLTVMVANVSPADDNFDETLSTLQYANRAKNIKNEAKRNEDVAELMIRQLREEIEGLRRALAAAQAGDGPDPAAKARMEETIANLERAKQQSWEEKERLSALYEAERLRNLESETKIRSVMQTIKEDNLELMARMRKLVNERERLGKAFKLLKEQHLQTREALAAEMARYQELYDLDGGDDGEHRGELEAILGRVEALHAQVESEAGDLLGMKEELRANEQSQLEERAEAAAQRMLLEEDAELRKAIAEEERAKLERQNEGVMAARIAEERRKLREAAARELASLEEKLSASAVSAREQELELALIQTQQERSLLLLESSEVGARHAAEVSRLRREHRREVQALRAEELRMFRELIDGFEEERGTLESKAADVSRQLASATAEVATLREQNADLRRQLVEAAAWEPPIY